VSTDGPDRAGPPSDAEGGRTAIVAMAVVVCAVLPVLLTGALAVQIRRELGLGPLEIGMATAAFFGAGALGSTLLGRLTQRLGPATGLRLSAGLSVVSGLGIALFATSVTSLFGLLAVAGLANAVSHPAANLALLQGVRPARQGFVFGIKQAAVPIAGLLAGLAVPAIALTVGWRVAFALGGGTALVMGVVAPLVVRRVEPPRQRGPVARLSVPLAPMLTLTAAAGLGAMAANSLGAFLVLSATESGLSEGGAGVLLSTSSAAGIAVRIAAGWLADRVTGGRLKGVAGLMLAGATGLALLAVPQPGTTIVGAIVAFALGWGWPGLFNFAVARTNPQAPATATGVVQTGIYIGASVGPWLFGTLVTASSYSVAWATMAAASTAGTLLMLAGRRGVVRARAAAATGPG
jgi:cyanate permease